MVLYPRNSPRAQAGAIELRRVFLLLAALLAFYFGLRYVYNTFIKSDEDKIRDAIHSAAQAARDRMPSGVTEILSDDFKGPEHLDKDMVHSIMVMLLVQTYRDVDVKIEPAAIPVTVAADKKSATAVFKAWFRGRPQGGSWETPRGSQGAGEGAELKAQFVNSDKGWRIKSIEVGGAK